MSLYNLAMFYRLGRHPNGSFFGENESVYNATERNLSSMTDAELIALRDGAIELLRLINTTFDERNVEETA